MLNENADLHLNILKLFPLFVRHNFLALESFLATKYFDRTVYLTATLTTVAKELSLSSHSSFADALKSFMTEEEEISELPSPMISQDKSNKHLVVFNTAFFRKPNFSFEETILEKAKLFNENSILEFVQFIVHNILTINLNKASFRLIVYLLEFAIDFLSRKPSVDPKFYDNILQLLDQVLDIEKQHTSKQEEFDFKEKFRNLRDCQEISQLLRGYFKFRVSLKMAMESGASNFEILQDYFSPVVHAGSAYMSLMIGVFESAVKNLLYKLSIKNSKSQLNVQSWQIVLKLILHIKSLALRSEEKIDGTDDSLGRLEALLSEISKNIKVNPTTIHCDIILVHEAYPGVHPNNVYLLSDLKRLVR